jgi:hypothetical protein
VLGAHRNSHFADRQHLDQFGDTPGNVVFNANLEGVHFLQSLMVFGAEDHLSLGGVKGHAFHRRDQSLGMGIAFGFLQGGDNCRGCCKATGGKEIRWLPLKVCPSNGDHLHL